ncbi:cadmium-transporting ATPase [Halobacteriales archaeon SW_7_68_16]|nr:MAG: cadmium-transporting ATPase [Halobacteriales archaeon SW_7_68_16]
MNGSGADEPRRSGGSDCDGHDRGCTHDGAERAPATDSVQADSPEGIVVGFDVPEMDCPSCAGRVEGALDGVSGVVAVETRPTFGRVLVTVADDTALDAVERAIEGAGYPVAGHDGDDRPDDTVDDVTRASIRRSDRALATAAGAVALVVGLVLAGVGPNPTVATVLDVPFAAAEIAFLVAVAAAGRAILRNGYYSLRTRNLDIDLLMAAAILSAVVVSLLAPETLYVEAATLAVLFGVSELLERYAMDRTRESVQELLDLSPDEVTRLRDGPADGTVRTGESAIDQSPITGESVPVGVGPGDEVYAGTINEGGYVEVEVATAPGEDTLSRIVDLVEDAERATTDREQFVERFAGYYTPAMLVAAILVAAVPPLALGAPVVEWFVVGIPLLVLACPCAFVISTPVSVISGITSAARNGVLIEGGRHLEAMGDVEAMAVDKTGTLTRGELTVTDVIPLGDREEADVLRCARGLEERSEHPIGDAIVAHADGEAVEGRSVSGFESLAGRGVRASLDGTRHYAGTPELFADLGFDLGHVHVADAGDALDGELRDRCDRQGCLDLVEDTIPRLQSQGKTVVLVGRTGDEPEIEGIVAVADDLRPEAAATVERLQSLGLSVVLLTGDNERAARTIAGRVGVDDYRAELLPEDKADAVARLGDEYDGVAMVGDGVNDAPALATATVGIAMGAAGSDTAIETADVALMTDDLSRLPYLTDLGRSAVSVIRQNVWASLAVKAVLAVGAPLGYVSVALAVLLGDAGMTLGVTGNAMRLARVVPEPLRSIGETGDADSTEPAVAGEVVTDD